METLRYTSGSIEDLFLIADFFADEVGTCFLHSGSVLDSAETSILVLFPYETATLDKQKIILSLYHQTKEYSYDNPWDALQEYFFQNNPLNINSIACGYFSYEMGFLADEDYTLTSKHKKIFPDAYWQRCVLTITFSHVSAEVQIHLNQEGYTHLSDEKKRWVDFLFAFTDLNSLVRTQLTKDSLPLSLKEFPDRRSTYLAQVAQAQESIRSGDVYQVNIAQQFVFVGERRPFDVFKKITSLNPAPFSIYLNHADFTIVSSSPERFLCKKGQRLETRPIKGTLPRGKNVEEDQRQKERLLSSTKEKAELLMITDLMRNDLAKISLVGSVVVKELWRCEAYRNVYHLLSIIQSEVRPELSPLSIVRSCFPGGSITGCPKMKALEVINRIENICREVYTGALGYFTENGDFDLNLAIRTLVFNQQEIYLNLGSGIVIDSDPEREYEETLHKGQTLFSILNDDENLEKTLESNGPMGN